MASQYVERCSTSLIIREMKIKIIMSYHFTPTKIAIIKEFKNNKCWRGYGEKGTLLHCWRECKLIQPNSKRHVYPSVHCSTFYNHQDMEAMYISISTWMDKEDAVIYTIEYYLAMKKNGFVSVAVRWINLEPVL